MRRLWEDVHRRQAIWVRVVAYTWLLVMFGLMLSSALQKSPTVDEDNHLTRGLAFLRTGDPRLRLEHPPLVNSLAALPILLDPLAQVPADLGAWQAGDWYEVADTVVWGRGAAADAVINTSRVPIMLLALLLGAIVFRWADEMYGVDAALLALTLYAFDPNILAHARLNTNDLGVTLFVFLTGYAAWRWLRRPPRLRSTLLTGCLIGLALGSKYLALILVLFFGLLMLIDRPTDSGGWRDRCRRFGWLALMGVAATLTLWALYGLHWDSPWPGGTTRWPLGLYLRGAVDAAGRAGTGQASFLLGQSSNGFWYYFPVAFLVKTPIPTLLLLVGAAVLTLRERSFPREAVLLFPCLGYLLVLMLSSFNLGYRHLLPMLPFLFTFAGKMAAKLKAGPLLLRSLGWLLPAWLIAASFVIWPHYLAYFNEAVGGPSNGHKIVVDSNIDWGQDLLGLEQYLNQEGITRLRLSYFGPDRPGYLGIDVEPLPGLPPTSDLWRDPPFNPENPEPGIYAISVTNLQELFFIEKRVYPWFRAREPDAVIGYSIHVYRVE